MRDGRLFIDGLFEYSVLVTANSCQHVEDVGVHGADPIGNERHDDPLPTGSAFFC